MQRGTKIARAIGRGHDKLRRIFLEGLCLKFYDGDTGSNLIATYTDDWWFDQHEHSDVVAGKKYKRLVVEDVNGCRLSVLRQATAVKVGDAKFKFIAKPSFIGSVPMYEFKLQPTGERV